MTYTTQQLQVMSDSQVNVALDLKLNKGAEFVGSHYVETGDGIYPNVIKHKSWPNYRECTDYCNNPNDIMPLAFERLIGLSPNKDSWEAFTLADNFQVISRQYIDKSPLRAIACLLLIMED